MKKLLTSLAGLALLLVAPMLATQSAAQGTAGSGVVLRVTVDGNVTDFYEGPCGYGTATWGGVPVNGLCGAPAWGRTATTSDTFACSAIPAGQLTGKMGMARRGPSPGTACGFSIKAFNLQQAGAVAALIANHNANATESDCHVQAMGATQPQSDQTTIPCFFMSRTMTNLIDNALKAGSNVDVCIVVPDVVIRGYFFPPLSKQTPVSQIPVDTFGFGITLTNTSGVNRTNVDIQAYVLDASNNVLYNTSLNIPVLDAGVTNDSSFTLPGLYAPELPIGTYKIRYTVTSDPIGGVPAIADRRETNFYVTQRMFAKDDGATTGFRPGTIGDFWGAGNMYTMNPKNIEKYMVKTIEFAFTTNATDLPVEDVAAEIAFFKLSPDVSPDYSNFNGTEFYTPSFEWLGAASYEAPTGLAGFTLQQVDIFNFNTGDIGVELDNDGKYIVAVNYSGQSRFAFQAFDQDAPHATPSTLVYNGQWFLGGFQGGPSAVLRMFIDLVNTTDEKALPETAMQIRPNPVVETLNLQVSFDQPTDATITIAEMSGRVITFENRDALTNELLTYQLPQLATGTYLARIATKQGTLTKKFVVQK